MNALYSHIEEVVNGKIVWSCLTIGKIDYWQLIGQIVHCIRLLSISSAGLLVASCSHENFAASYSIAWLLLLVVKFS